LRRRAPARRPSDLCRRQPHNHSLQSIGAALHGRREIESDVDGNLLRRRREAHGLDRIRDHVPEINRSDLQPGTSR